MSKSALKTKGLIQGFEEGKVGHNDESSVGEKIESYPGVTQKMKETYQKGAMGNDEHVAGEKIESFPGVTKKMVDTYETIQKERTAPPPPVVRRTTSMEAEAAPPAATAAATPTQAPATAAAAPAATAEPPPTAAPATAPSPPAAAAAAAEPEKKAEVKSTVEAGDDAANLIQEAVTEHIPKLHVLIVHAHEEPDSLNASLTRVTKETLEAQGHTVTLSDLYAMNFNPVMSRKDVKDDKTEGKYNYPDAVKQAYAEGRMADDIMAEHKKIKQADLIILQFPFTWGGLMPAILHGYIERVFSNGFAHVASEGQIYDNGPLKGKKILLSVTVALKETAHTSTGLQGDINTHLWPIHNTTLRFCGFDVLAPHLVYGTMVGFTEEKAKAELDGWKRRLVGIGAEKPLSFIPLEHFDMNTMQLKEEVLQALQVGGDNGPQRGINVGQHLGKAIPPDTMLKPGLQIALGKTEPAPTGDAPPKAEAKAEAKAKE